MPLLLLLMLLYWLRPSPSLTCTLMGKAKAGRATFQVELRLQAAGPGFCLAHAISFVQYMLSGFIQCDGLKHQHGDDQMTRAMCIICYQHKEVYCKQDVFLSE